MQFPKPRPAHTPYPRPPSTWTASRRWGSTRRHRSCLQPAPPAHRRERATESITQRKIQNTTPLGGRSRLEAGGVYRPGRLPYPPTCPSTSHPPAPSSSHPVGPRPPGPGAVKWCGGGVQGGSRQLRAVGGRGDSHRRQQPCRLPPRVHKAARLCRALSPADLVFLVGGNGSALGAGNALIAPGAGGHCL